MLDDFFVVRFSCFKLCAIRPFSHEACWRFTLLGKFDDDAEIGLSGIVHFKALPLDIVYPPIPTVSLGSVDYSDSSIRSDTAVGISY